MNDGKRTDREDAINEVELSAEELLEFAPPTQTQLDACIEPRGAVTAPEPEGVVDAIANTFKRRRLSASWIVLALGLPVAATAVIGVQYNGASPESVRVATDPAPEPLDAAQPEAAQALPPVLFTNPFDKTEVFEFPAGTSREEARAAVADVLMKRAAERQASP